MGVNDAAQGHGAGAPLRNAPCSGNRRPTGLRFPPGPLTAGCARCSDTHRVPWAAGEGLPSEAPVPRSLEECQRGKKNQNVVGQDAQGSRVAWALDKVEAKSPVPALGGWPGAPSTAQPQCTWHTALSRGTQPASRAVCCLRRWLVCENVPETCLRGSVGAWTGPHTWSGVCKVRRG